MSQNTKVVIVSVLVMLVGIAGSGILNVAIASSQGTHELVYTDKAEEGAPVEVSLGVAMGAFRGIFVNILWLRANKAKEEGRYYESIELARTITKLQPRLPEVWTFHAWNMAYNISVTTHTPQERWEWVNAGIDLLRKEGLRTNPNNMHIHKELSWYLLHKVGGYTDDANQYYKRRFAYEWQNVLGSPPLIDPEQRGRDQVIELYAGWIQPIVDAPQTFEALRRENPKAAEIGDAFRERVGEELGVDFLRRYQLELEINRAGRVWIFEDPNLGAKTRAVHQMRSDFPDEQAWTDLANHLRKRVLIDEYNMEPVRMVQQVRKFGPIDWRLPVAHSLYWSARGTDVGRMEVNERNAETLDFLNAFRMMMQSIQELWRHGDLYFSYLDAHEGRAAYYQGVPNVYFVPTYGALLEEIVYQSGIYEADHKPYRQYAVGYENFLRDAIRFFYRRGDIAKANFWYDKLRNFEGLNLNDPDRTYEMSLSLEDFVDKQLYDSLGSPQVANSEVYGALTQAYIQGLLVGDIETFEGMFEYARKVHAYYFQQQYREVVTGTEAARMEFMDRDFPLLAGQLFVNVIMQMPVEQAELVYYYAPDSLRRYAYDALAIQLRDRLDALAEQGKSEPFSIIFPEPPGMESFRAELNRKLRQRSQNQVEGVKQN